MSLEVIDGVMTFDGKGNFHSNGTQYHTFDQGASDATVSITCNEGLITSTNNGHPVYNPPVAFTLTGTYTVNRDGTGSYTVTPPPGDNGNGITEDFRLAGTSHAVVAGTVLLRDSDGQEISVATGVLVHE